MRRETPALPGEDLVLDLFDVVLEAFKNRHVTVDDRVQNRVDHTLGSEAELLWVRLETSAHQSQIRAAAMAHRQHEILAGEDVQLAELNLFNIIEIACGPQHHEQGVVVAFELAALVGDDGVLNGQLVQLEQLAQLGEVFGVRLI